MTVLLLGSSGYLGSAIQKKLKAKNVKFLSPSKFDCNLEIPGSLINFISRNAGEVKISKIINCAVYQRTGDRLISEKDNIFIKNTLINNSIIEFYYFSKKRPELISIGASCAFSMDGNNQNYFAGNLNSNVEPFALPKRHFAHAIKHLSDISKFNWNIFVPGTLIGAGEQLDTTKKHFVNGAIYRAVLAQKTQKKFTQFGDMSAIREVTNVETFAEEILENDYCKNTIINTKNTVRVRVGQIYDWIERNFNELKFVQGTTNFEAQKSKLLNDYNESYANTDWLDEQLHKLVRYYKSQLDV